MKIQILVASLLLLFATVVLICGCQRSGQAQTQSEFAPGAFPPTVTDTDYHRRSWTRSDCLACHEQGAQAARTCRVILPRAERRISTCGPARCAHWNAVQDAFWLLWQRTEEAA